MPVPERKPRKAPTEAFRDAPALFFAKMSSKAKEKITDAAIIPTGRGKSRPAKSHKVAPQAAYLLPPEIFVNPAGIT